MQIQLEQTGKKYNREWIFRGLSHTFIAGKKYAITGPNGSGKSTLLKLIAGTARPTTGQITVNGRITALLELGMGFHADFTGRENVLMSARIAGIQIGRAHV